MLDEIVTGIRLAPGGTQEYFGVVSDITTLGNLLGDGHALAAICGRRQLLELVDHECRGRTLYASVSSTVNGNTVSAAAGLATLDVPTDPGVYGRLYEADRSLSEGLRNGCAGAGMGAHVLGIAPMFRVVIADERPIDYRDVPRSNDSARARSHPPHVRRSVFVSPDKRYVSLVHSDEELDREAAALGEALAAVHVPAASCSNHQKEEAEDERHH